MNILKRAFIRPISILMIAVMLISIAPLNGFADTDWSDFALKANAATELTSDYYTYKLSDGKAIITDVKDTTSGKVTIPSTLGGYPVSEIGAGAFSSCYEITEVVIPNSVTRVNMTAFWYCTKLSKVTIPNSVQYIGSQAFGACKLLATVDIPASVTDIDSSAFYACEGLTAINVASGNSSYTSVSGILFNKAKTELVVFPANYNAISYTVPDSVKRIRGYSFFGAKNLNEIKLPVGLVSVGEYAFSRCTSIERIDIPESVGVIDESAFSNCTSLNSFVLPDKIRSIEIGTFQGCENLKRVVLPENLERICGYAFSGCKSLQITEFPETIASIGACAFLGTSYYYDANNWRNGVFSLNTYILGTNRDFVSETYNIGSQITIVADEAFSYTDCLKNVIVPETVKRVGQNAFRNCKNLSKINLPDAAMDIGANAFYGTAYYDNTSNWDNSILYIGKHLIRYENNQLGSYTVKSGTKSIAENAVVYSYFKDLTIPDSVAFIGDGALNSCSYLKEFKVNSNNRYYCSDNGVLFNKNKTELVAFPKCKEIESYTVPAAVKVIGKQAFNSSKLKTLVLQNGIKEIHEEAFSYSNIYNFTFPKSIEYIGEDVLSYYTVNVGYIGTEAEWNNITIHPDNENLEYATLICNYVPHAHSYTSKITKTPTCKESGLRAYTCQCGSTYSVYVYDYSAHQLDSGKVTKKATYKKTGTKVYVCKICGNSIKTETIPKLTLGKVSGLKSKSIKVDKSSSITLSWDKIDGADKYEVYQKSGKKWKKIKTTTKTSYKVKELKAGSTYQFKVRAVRPKDDIKGSYSEVLKVKIAPKTTTLTLKAGSKQLTATWKSVSDISGYEVQYSTSKKFTKKTTKTVKVKKSSKKTTVKKLKKGKKYYVRIRTYKTVNGKKIYSDWSKVKNVKVK